MTTADPDAAPLRLLAVDLGLRTGVAWFGRDGRLVAARSTHLANREQLRRAVERILDEHDVAHVVLEGDVALSRIWERAAHRRRARTRRVSPEVWRQALLHPSQRRDAADAKRSAQRLAHTVARWSSARAPTPLRHDAAEAVCIGLWAVVALGWLDPIPAPFALPPRRA